MEFAPGRRAEPDVGELLIVEQMLVEPAILIAASRLKLMKPMHRSLEDAQFGPAVRAKFPFWIRY